MPICPKCHRSCKTAQGLSGHMRFRHQMTIPKQDLPVYARDRLEKAEDENARLREQVARLQKQRQYQETFYEKRMAEQKTDLERDQERKLAEQQKVISKQREEQKIELARAQERKLAEQQRVAALKQQEEQIRSERARAEAEAVAALQKQIQDIQKRIEANSQKKKTDESPLMYTDASRASTVEPPREPATSSRWKPSDFLPAAFPHLPLPRGLFKH